MTNTNDTPYTLLYTTPAGLARLGSETRNVDLEGATTSTVPPKPKPCSLRLGGVPLVAYSIVDATLAAGPRRRGS